MFFRLLFHNCLSCVYTCNCYDPLHTCNCYDPLHVYCNFISLIAFFSDETRNFYNDVQTASTSEEFSDLKSQATSAAVFYYTEPSDQSSETPSSSYKVSNPIRITEFIFKIILQNNYL